MTTADPFGVYDPSDEVGIGMSDKSATPLPRFKPLAELRCHDCGGTLGAEGTILALRGAELLPYCGPACARKHGWPWME